MAEIEGTSASTSNGNAGAAAAEQGAAEPPSQPRSNKEPNLTKEDVGKVFKCARTNDS